MMRQRALGGARLAGSTVKATMIIITTGAEARTLGGSFLCYPRIERRRLLLRVCGRCILSSSTMRLCSKQMYLGGFRRQANALSGSDHVVKRPWQSLLRSYPISAQCRSARLSCVYS